MTVCSTRTCEGFGAYIFDHKELSAGLKPGWAASSGSAAPLEAKQWLKSVVDTDTYHVSMSTIPAPL